MKKQKSVLSLALTRNSSLRLYSPFKRSNDTAHNTNPQSSPEHIPCTPSQKLSSSGKKACRKILRDKLKKPIKKIQVGALNFSRLNQKGLNQMRPLAFTQELEKTKLRSEGCQTDRPTPSSPLPQPSLQFLQLHKLNLSRIQNIQPNQESEISLLKKNKPPAKINPALRKRLFPQDFFVNY